MKPRSTTHEDREEEDQELNTSERVTPQHDHAETCQTSTDSHQTQSQANHVRIKNIKCFNAINTLRVTLDKTVQISTSSHDCIETITIMDVCKISRLQSHCKRSTVHEPIDCTVIYLHCQLLVSITTVKNGMKPAHTRLYTQKLIKSRVHHVQKKTESLRVM